MPVPAYRPAPEQYTQPLAMPPAPPAKCQLHGKPAICAGDGLISIEDWRGVVRRANADRATIRAIGAAPTTGGEP